jgi:hypothetical protein
LANVSAAVWLARDAITTLHFSWMNVWLQLLAYYTSGEFDSITVSNSAGHRRHLVFGFSQLQILPGGSHMIILDGRHRSENHDEHRILREEEIPRHKSNGNSQWGKKSIKWKRERLETGCFSSAINKCVLYTLKMISIAAIVQSQVMMREYFNCFHDRTEKMCCVRD